LEKRVISSQAHTKELIDDAAGPPRGLLQWPPPEGRFRYTRRLPPPDLTPWITHFHVVFEEGRSQVNGVATG